MAGDNDPGNNWLPLSGRWLGCALVVFGPFIALCGYGLLITKFIGVTPEREASDQRFGLLFAALGAIMLITGVIVLGRRRR